MANHSNISSLALSQLTPLSCLDHLELSSCPVDDSAAVHICTLARLTKLDLNACPITNATLAQLTSLSCLRTLAIVCPALGRCEPLLLQCFSGLS